MADEVATAEETQKAEEEVQNSSKDESKEPATVTGVVVKGVVNWFNVAKGFGELAFVAPIPARSCLLFSRSPRLRSPRPRRTSGSPLERCGGPERARNSTFSDIAHAPGRATP